MFGNKKKNYTIKDDLDILAYKKSDIFRLQNYLRNLTKKNIKEIN